MMEPSIAALHAAMQRGELTSRQLVQECLHRIEAYDQQGPKLNVVIRLNPRALELADELDGKRSSGLVGPLHGIPILLKDNIDTADLPTTAGSVCLDNHQPQQDAWLVRRLKDAGAIILAKVNLHEFAVWGETVSSLQGQTLNPYDLTRTPGGSSGGNGAGVAAGFGVAGIGTDTVNSVRSPASANSLVGIRPTTGLVSRAGLVPYSFTQDTAGPICRNVADAALLLTVMAGYDPADSRTAWSVGNIPREGYCPTIADNQLRGCRLGILNSLFGKGPEHAEVNVVIHTCIAKMQELGAEFVALAEPLDSAYLAGEVSVHLFDLERDLNSYLKNLEPTAPVHTLQEVVDSGRFHPGIAANLRQAMALKPDSLPYLQRLREQDRLKERLLDIMAANRLDALVFPHQQRLVVKIGETQVERNGVLASVTGFPSITIPAGFSTPSVTAPLGVPIGIEFLARPWSERALIALAGALEQAMPLRKAPKL
jgi:Asp-tRNA(Asn)/Glu-tRNA(Gln) amidotransferase A subunit family amidase